MKKGMYSYTEGSNATSTGGGGSGGTPRRGHKMNSKPFSQYDGDSKGRSGQHEEVSIVTK